MSAHLPNLPSLFTPGGLIMFAAGCLTWRSYCWLKNRYLDKVDPEHAPHRGALKMVVIAWGILFSGIFYIGVQTQNAHDQTVKLSDNVTRCWSETYQQVRAQVELNAQNDAVSRAQQALQREYDEDTAVWIKELIAPPGDLATQPTNSPERQAYGIKVSEQYQAQLDDLGRRFDQQVAQRKALDAKRAAHPLPEARCGRS